MIRQERQKLERVQWIEEAVAYIFSIKLYNPEIEFERYLALELADSLHYHNKDEGGEMICTPQEAVDEELSYWGD